MKQIISNKLTVPINTLNIHVIFVQKTNFANAFSFLFLRWSKGLRN